MAKLSDRQKNNIIAKWKTGTYTNIQLAKTYKVDEKTIRNVINGKTKIYNNNSSINKNILTKTGLLYIIRMGTTNYYKIGITRNPIEKRLRELQTGNPIELIIEKTFEREDILKIEKQLHKKYEKNKQVGEWFLLNRETIEYIITHEV